MTRGRRIPQTGLTILFIELLQEDPPALVEHQQFCSPTHQAVGGISLRGFRPITRRAIDDVEDFFIHKVNLTRPLIGWC
jgi:hypothetical protein